MGIDATCAVLAFGTGVSPGAITLFCVAVLVGTCFLLVAAFEAAFDLDALDFDFVDPFAEVFSLALVLLFSWALFSCSALLFDAPLAVGFGLAGLAGESAAFTSVAAFPLAISGFA